MNAVECPKCGRMVKNLRLHERWSHAEAVKEPVFVRETEDNVMPEEPKFEPVTKSQSEIAEIIYKEVVTVVCEEAKIDVLPWDAVDKRPYLAVAGKILGE